MKSLFIQFLLFFVISTQFQAQTWTEVPKPNSNLLVLGISCGSESQVLCEAVTDGTLNCSSIYKLNQPSGSTWTSLVSCGSGSSNKHPDIASDGTWWYVRLFGSGNYATHSSFPTPSNVNNTYRNNTLVSGRLFFISTIGGNQGIGTVGGSNNNIYETTNAGGNYSQIQGTQSIEFSKVERGYDNSLFGITTTTVRKYNSTTNTWVSLTVPSGTGNITDIAVADENRVLIVKNGNLFRKAASIDGWELITNPITNAISRVSIGNDGTIYILGSTTTGSLNKIYKTNFDCLGPINTTPASNLTFCGNSSTVLSAYGYTSPEWFDVETGGNPIAVSSNYSTPVLSTTTTYFVQLNNTTQNCNPHPRIPITVTINQQVSTAPIINVSSQLCITEGVQANIGVISQVADNYIKWYTDSTSTTPIATGANFTTPNLWSTTTYWAAEQTGTNCISPKRKVVVTVASNPTNTTTPDANPTICGNNTTTLTATGPGLLRWYDVPTGGSLLGSGSSFVTPSLTANTTYYVESVQGTCVSGRTSIAVTVLTSPPLAVNNTPTQNLTICSGNSTTISIVEPNQSLYQIEWWTSQTSNTVIDYNLVFTTPNLTTTTTYWVNLKSYSNDCSSARIPITVSVVSGLSAGTLSGNQSICSGSTTTFNSTVSGGTWSSSNSSIASVIPSTGVITGNTAGTATITYSVSAAGCPAATSTRTVNVIVAPSAGTISGVQNICLGNTTSFSSTVANGIWSSSNPAIATVSGVNSTTGLINSVSAGNVTITYTIDGGICPDAIETRTIAITAAPNAGTLSGNSDLCAGSTTNFSSTQNNGVWSSSNNSVATVNSNGVVTAIGSGSSIISYTVTGTGGCADAIATRNINVSITPSAGTISGTQSICLGNTTPFSSTVGDGTWGSSNSAVATISGINATTGLINSVSAGTVTITYTIDGGICPDGTATRTITITTPPSAGTLSGNTLICEGATSNFSSTEIGGTWSSDNTSVATINNSGLITGVAAGNSTITYTVLGLGGCSDATATRVISVSDAPNAGTINGIQSICQASTSTLVSTELNGVWSSLDANIASISSNGVVEGISPGQTTINYTVSGTGICADAVATFNVTIVENGVMPTFNPIAAICSGDTFTLPNTSLNGVNGVWSPAINNQETTTYTFTPTSGACTSEEATLTVVVNPTVTPIFDLVSAICAGDEFDALPTTSENSIVGTWSPSLNLTQTTTYLFTPQLVESCIQSVNFTLTINPLPSSLSETQNDNVLSVNNTYANYEWFNVQNPTTILGTQSTFTATENGTYSVNVYSTQGCMTVSEPFVVEGLSISEDLAQSNLVFYPNPVSDVITIENVKGSKLKLLDLSGKELISIPFAAEIEKINVSALPVGVYVFQVQNLTKSISFKVIVE